MGLTMRPEQLLSRRYVLGCMRAASASTLPAALCVGLALLIPSFAFGAFSGRDGEIAYTRTIFTCADDCSAGGDDYSYVALSDPGGRHKFLFGCSLRTGLDYYGGPCGDVSPAWSPDGERIAIVDKFGGSSAIEIGAKDGTGANPVQGAHGNGPAWSPDARNLVFAAPARGRRNLYVIAARGGRARLLTRRGGQFPAWSVNGQIAFSRRTRAGFRNVLVIPAEGGRAHQLTRRGGDHPDWSPTGSLIAFDRAPDARVPKRREIYVAAFGGGHLRRLTHGGGTDPAWSPNGKRIAFVRSGKIYWIGLRRRHGHRIGAGSDPDWQPLPRDDSASGLSDP